MIKINFKPQGFGNIEKEIPCGFHMTFTNGNIISVQWGFGTYSHGKEESKVSSSDVEIAIVNKAGKWYNFGDDTVKGYLPMDELADYISFAKNTTF